MPVLARLDGIVDQLRYMQALRKPVFWWLCDSLSFWEEEMSNDARSSIVKAGDEVSFVLYNLLIRQMSTSASYIEIFRPRLNSKLKLVLKPKNNPGKSRKTNKKSKQNWNTTTQVQAKAEDNKKKQKLNAKTKVQAKFQAQESPTKTSKSTKSPDKNWIQKKSSSTSSIPKKYNKTKTKTKAPARFEDKNKSPSKKLNAKTNVHSSKGRSLYGKSPNKSRMQKQIVIQSLNKQFQPKPERHEKSS